MTEQSLVYSSNGIGLTADSVENKLAELFADTHCLVNLKTGKTMLLSMAYLFATCLNDVDPEMFDAEEIKNVLTGYLNDSDRDLNKLYKLAIELKCEKILRTYMEVLL